MFKTFKMLFLLFLLLLVVFFLKQQRLVLSNCYPIRVLRFNKLSVKHLQHVKFGFNWWYVGKFIRSVFVKTLILAINQRIFNLSYITTYNRPDSFVLWVLISFSSSSFLSPILLTLFKSPYFLSSSVNSLFKILPNGE